MSDSYTGPNFRLDVVSRVERDNNTVTLRTEVTPSGSAVDGAQFFMPALLSLNSLKQQADPIDYSQQFLSIYRDSKNFALKAEGPKWTFKTNLAVAASAQARVYRIVHPILIKYEETRDCIMVSAISPVPVSFPIADCRTLGRN